MIVRAGRRTNLVVALATAAVVLWATVAGATQASFRWGGQTWTKDEGQQFQAWLTSRGASPKVFKKRHPQLAAVFGPKWPSTPEATLRGCASSSCVPAVVRAVFGSRAATALRVVGCETGGTFSPYATGDGGTSHGIWQIHLPAHPDVTLAEARSPWISTQIAYRWSSLHDRDGNTIPGTGGLNFSPTWTCATILGIP